MAQVSRKAQPDCLRYFLMHLRFPGITTNSDDVREDSCQVETLVETLVKMGGYAASKYRSDISSTGCTKIVLILKGTAKETIAHALSDGLLMPVSPLNEGSSPRPRTGVAELKRVRLPNSQEVRVNSSHDWYCYECHLPGALSNCIQCWRSFHRLCYRKNPERPNYAVPSSKKQKNRLPAFSSDTESDSSTMQERGSTIMDSETEIRANSSLMQVDNNQKSPTISTGNVDNPISPRSLITTSSSYIIQAEPKPLVDDLESKVEVVCLGEVRPPNRRRPNTTASNVSYKSEVSFTNDDEQDLDLCTGCRLLKRANLNNPPNLQADELSHLINYTFSYNREWLNQDVREYLNSQLLNVKEINLVNHLLLYSPIKRLNDIETKMKRHEYSLLTEFLVDLLDIQHNIGVFFGRK